MTFDKVLITDKNNVVQGSVVRCRHSPSAPSSGVRKTQRYAATLHTTCLEEQSAPHGSSSDTGSTAHHEQRVGQVQLDNIVNNTIEPRK